MPTPSQRYYGSAHGRWTGTVDFRITDWRAFFAAPMGLLDKLSIAMVALLPSRLLGSRIDTRVLCLPDREAPTRMVHRIWLSQLGRVVYRTEEDFDLHPDGRSLTILMTEYAVPRLSVPRVGAPSPGEVEDDAAHAHYSLPWYGTTVDVRTHLTPTTCEIAVTTPWARGVQRVRKVTDEPGPDALVAPGPRTRSV